MRYSRFRPEPSTRQITMTVTSGYTLGDVEVDFAPDGTVFQPPARLTLHLWWAYVEKITPELLESLKVAVDHITDDGYVTEAAIELDNQGQACLMIVIEVPGFSRYGLSGDYFSADGYWTWVNGF